MHYCLQHLILLSPTINMEKSKTHRKEESPQDLTVDWPILPFAGSL